MRQFKAPATRLCAALGMAFTLVGGAAAAPAAPAADTTRVIVQFKPGSAAVAAARAAIAKAGGRVKVELIEDGPVAIELPTKMLAALKRNANIAAIEEDAKRYPMALTSPSGPPYKTGQLVPYGIKMVQADQLPNNDNKTANRTLCVIDSGYDVNHEDLSGNNVSGEFDSGTGWWYNDGTHHGTHVAGTIAAMNNAGVGVVGVNPNKKLKLFIVKVFGDDGTFAYSSTLAAAANKCKANGANIITMSLGGPLLNPLEQRTFNKLEKAGILSIAAAGNGGNSKTSYPAGYSSVVSVAGVDEFKAKYTASQFNKDVEITAPAVQVLSTVPMGTGRDATLKVGSTVYVPSPMDGSPVGTISAPLADFGLGDATNSAVAGKVCLIARGTISFSDKVLNCQNSGGVGAVVYNNEPGGFGGTLGGVATTIPSVTVTDTDGAAMLAQLGQTTAMSLTATNYAYFDGTSMATPHVSGVAALVWSYFPTCTNKQIRNTLNKSAEDLGTPGRDNIYGFGLVQAKAAYDRLKSLGCNN